MNKKWIIAAVAALAFTQVSEVQAQFTNHANMFDLYHINGNVGIGTQEPEARLHLRSSTGQELTFMEAGNSSYPYRVNVEFNNDGMVFDNSTTDRGYVFKNQNTPTGSLMEILHDGRVNIGATTTPGTYRLYVAEGILTERVRVAIEGTMEWADYVFEDDYELRSLKELETFIDKNGHLPDIPSAQEVSDAGIDLAKMDASLLRKVEELSLYVIELNKKINTLETQLSEADNK